MPEYSALLSSYEAILPLRLASDLTAPDKAEYILQKTGVILGEITSVIKESGRNGACSRKEKMDQ